MAHHGAPEADPEGSYGYRSPAFGSSRLPWCIPRPGGALQAQRLGGSVARAHAEAHAPAALDARALIRLHAHVELLRVDLHLRTGAELPATLPQELRQWSARGQQVHKSASQLIQF